MHFAPDTDDTLRFAVQLADTAPRASRSGADELDTSAQLDAFLDGWGYTGRRDHDERELREVCAVRDTLFTLWEVGTDDAVAIINRMLAEGRALPYLYRHDGSPWHLHASDLDAPLAERIGNEIALALVDVIRSGETRRLRLCAADDCGGIFVDFSRNGSKRFCSIRCGNRMNMVAFRERQAAEGEATAG
ncbi:MAG TPA: CGNR zinc finger domain-containing protein [Pseudolysinimonas sp.]|nr:CGNR zinc finger domain-containing protein [Pseudolysinimonas sp.]